LVFVNTDVQALAGWLENLMNAAEHHPEYQILCSFVLPETEGNKVRTLNAFGDAVRFPCPSTGDIIDSLFAVGGCFLIRRSWLDKLGYLFDPYYFCYAEDSELSLRTVLLGGRIGYVRSSKLYHFGGGSELSSERIIYLGTRNMLLTYYKLLRVQTFILLCSLNLTYKAIQFMRKRQTSNLISLVKGTLAFFFSHSRYTQYRRDFNEIKLRTDRYLLERLFYRSEREEKFFKRLYRVSSGFNPLIAQSKP
jgi:GT2 family glycosyltransferase